MDIFCVNFHKQIIIDKAYYVNMFVAIQMYHVLFDLNFTELFCQTTYPHSKCLYVV